jgi:hypothetical protein
MDQSIMMIGREWNLIFLKTHISNGRKTKINIFFSTGKFQELFLE